MYNYKHYVYSCYVLLLAFIMIHACHTCVANWPVFPQVRCSSCPPGDVPESKPCLLLLSACSSAAQGDNDFKEIVQTCSWLAVQHAQQLGGIFRRVTRATHMYGRAAQERVPWLGILFQSSCPWILVSLEVWVFTREPRICSWYVIKESASKRNICLSKCCR